MGMNHILLVKKVIIVQLPDLTYWYCSEEQSISQGSGKEWLDDVWSFISKLKLVSANSLSLSSISNISSSVTFQLSIEDQLFFNSPFALKGHYAKERGNLHLMNYFLCIFSSFSD